MSYGNIKRDQAIANDYLANNQPCNRCKAPTPVEDLMSYGARCRGCYEAYLAEKNPAGWPSRPLTPDERMAVRDRGTKALRMLAEMRTDPKRWARVLQEREESGEVLTTIQSQAWKEALKPRIELEETL